MGAFKYIYVQGEQNIHSLPQERLLDITGI